MDSEIKFKIKELSKKKWMKVSLIFEVLGTTREIVEKSLKEHIEKLEKIKTIFLYNKCIFDLGKKTILQSEE